jgi:hypothetical protein
MISVIGAINCMGSLDPVLVFSEDFIASGMMDTILAASDAV